MIFPASPFPEKDIVTVSPASGSIVPTIDAAVTVLPSAAVQVGEVLCTLIIPFTSSVELITSTLAEPSRVIARSIVDFLFSDILILLYMLYAFTNDIYSLGAVVGICEIIIAVRSEKFKAVFI